MTWEELIMKDISLRFYKDMRVIKAICHHPFLFSKKKIEDPNDIRAIMIPHFGKFVMKALKTMDSKIRNVKKYNDLIAKKSNQKLNTNVEGS